MTDIYKSIWLIIFLTCILTFNSLSIKSQFNDFTFELDKIVAECNDSTSDYFYPILFQRYVNNDTSLTFLDYKHLYYAFTYQDFWEPFPAICDIETQRFDIKRKSVLEANDYDTLYKYSMLILEKLPFTVSYLQDIVSYYELKEDYQMVRLYKTKISMISRIIRSSGDGLSENTPFYINSSGDEVEFLKYLSLSPVPVYDNGFEMNGNYDILRLKKNSEKLKRCYFYIIPRSRYLKKDQD
jgi:hypothetical protein